MWPEKETAASPGSVEVMDDLAHLLHERVERDLVGLLERYVEIPCLSPHFAHGPQAQRSLLDAAELMADFTRSRPIAGLTCEVVEIPDKTPSLVVEIPATSDADGCVLLYGHLDKQPPLGDWSAGLDPFRSTRRGDLLYGRGTADDGYSLPAALLAIEAMDEAGIPRSRCVILIEASEESGSPDLEAHLDLLADAIDGTDLVICLDSGALDYKRLWLTTSLRGNIVLTLSAEVLSQGVHSGEAGGVVPSSFSVLRLLLDRIEDPATGELRPEILQAAPSERTMAEAAHVNHELGDPLVRHFPTVDGLELFGRDGTDRLLRQSWSASLSVTGASGLPGISEAGNVLRPSTTLKLSVRTPPSVDVTKAANELVSILEANPPHGATVSADVLQKAPGWVAAEPAPWVLDALDEGSVAGFGHRPGLLGEGGSIPFLSMLGSRFEDAQFVVTGVLGPGSNAHGPDESLHIPTAANITRAVVSVLAAHARR